MKASRKRPHARRPLFPVRTSVRRGSVARAASPAARPDVRNNISQGLSLYSLTSSHVHSTLNTLASIALAANSAIAFANITINQKSLTIYAILAFLLSLFFYGLAAWSIFSVNKKVYESIQIGVNDMHFYISFIQKELVFSTKYIAFSIISSAVFFAIIALGINV